MKNPGRLFLIAFALAESWQTGKVFGMEYTVKLNCMI